MADMRSNFEIWYDEHGEGETTKHVAHKAYRAGFDDCYSQENFPSAVQQAMESGAAAIEAREALAASQREREQLQEIIATKNRQELQLQAQVEAAEKLAAKWEKNCDAASFDQWHAQQLRAALASPPAAPVQAEGKK